MIDKLDFLEIKGYYDLREDMHKQLHSDFTSGNMSQYVRNALGIDDNCGNYSASEYGLGPKILAETSLNGIFKLAQDLDKCTKKSHIPKIIYEKKIPYLKISVGSEMAMMLRPNEYWVGNVRTMWAHLLLKHEWKRKTANEELKLYQDKDRNSEMDYQVWRYLYLSAEENLLSIASLGTAAAKKQGVSPGKFTFLWADAIASSLYSNR